MYWTVLCYHPYLVSMLFAELLSLHLVTFLFLFMSLFLAVDACLIMSWSFPSLASYAVLAEESQAFFKLSQHTNSISNSAILRNNLHFVAKWFVRMRTREEKWRRKVNHSSSMSGSNRLMWLQTWKKAMGWCTTQWKMLLFCVKTIMKETNLN